MLDRLLWLQRPFAHIFRRRDLFLLFIDAYWINGLITLAPCADRRVDGHLLIIEDDVLFLCGDAQQGEGVIQDALIRLDDDASRHQVIEGRFASAGSADMVAEAHLADGFRDAAEFYRGGRYDRALADQLAHLVEVALQFGVIRGVIRMRMMRDHINIVSGFLEFR